MPNELGCVLRPAKAGLEIGSILSVAEGDLPENYVVPAYRDLFDAGFRPVPAKLAEFIRNQNGIPSCVGHATANQKGAQEGVRMSPRDIYRLAKLIDGFGDPLSWGTTLSAAQDAMVEPGTASEDLVPDLPHASRAQYVSQDDVSDAVRADRKTHKALKNYFVPRTDFRRTLFQTGFPVVTSCGWHESDDAIGASGIMGMPTGAYRGGHAFACIGWRTLSSGVALIMVNHFGSGWGDNGLFYVPFADAFNRLTSGYVSVDIDAKLAELLMTWNERNVKSPDSPKVYRIQYGVKRQYENEIVFFAFGQLFSTDVWEITSADLAAIPEGRAMDISDAPFRTRELVREMRLLYSKS